MADITTRARGLAARSVLAALAAVALSGLALADGEEGSLKDAPAAEEREFSWSMTIGGTSDYVFRGVSQTLEDPAFQMSVDMSYGIFYAGVWGSNVDFADCCNEAAEIDFYAGITPELGKLSFDFGVLYYFYPNTELTPGREFDYVEFKAGVKTEIVPKLTIGGTVYYTPDYVDETGAITTVEGSANYELPAMGIFTPTIGGQIGASFSENAFAVAPGDEYTYWNAGVVLAVENFTFDFRYWDTDVDSDPTGTYNVDLFDERFVFSAKVTVP